MLERLMTRRKLILLASVSSFLSGCSMFSSDRYSYQPVSYDNSEGSKVLRRNLENAKYKKKLPRKAAIPNTIKCSNYYLAGASSFLASALAAGACS